jgi:hypothetical protein
MIILGLFSPPPTVQNDRIFLIKRLRCLFFVSGEQEGVKSINETENKKETLLSSR